MSDDTVTIDTEMMLGLRKMKKDQLIEKFAKAAVEAQVFTYRMQTAIETERQVLKENEKLKKELADYQTKLDKAEAYIEQGRAMINAIMERWYEYDV